MKAGLQQQVVLWNLGEEAGSRKMTHKEERWGFNIKGFFELKPEKLDPLIDKIKQLLSSKPRGAELPTKILSSQQSRTIEWKISKPHEDATQGQLTSTEPNRLHAMSRAIMTLWKAVGLGCLVSSYVVVSWMLVRAALGNHVQVLSFNDLGELWFEFGLWIVGFPQVVWWFIRYRNDERPQER